MCTTEIRRCVESWWNPSHCDTGGATDLFPVASKSCSYWKLLEVGKCLCCLRWQRGGQDRTGQPVGDRPMQPGKHRLGLCLMSKNRKFLQNARQESVNTNFKQLKPKKSNDSFKDYYGSKSWNFVKPIKEVLLRWKN